MNSIGDGDGAKAGAAVPNPTVQVGAAAGKMSNLDGIDVRVVNPTVGRGVFAKRKFTKGEIVFTDSPIVSCQFAWNQMYKYLACGYCMRALESAVENARRLANQPNLELPFEECCDTKQELHVFCNECDARYCSAECRDQAWTEYHSVLCFHTKEPPEGHPIKNLDLYWRLMHYPPETANIFLLVKLLVKIHLDKDGSLRQRLESFCSASLSENEDLAHKILGEEHKERIIGLLALVKPIVNFDNIQEYLTPEGFLKLFVILGRNGQGVGTSSFAAWIENFEKLPLEPEIKDVVLKNVDDIYQAMDRHVGHFLDNEGSALYPIQSWVNHSCVANTEVKFPYRNHIVGLVATRDIEETEEITICYLDLAEVQRSRYSRNKFLTEHYLFVCNCEKCIEQLDQDDCTSDEGMEDDDGEDDSEEGDDLEELNDSDLSS